MSKIKLVGVIGAGQMGSGIAHVCALAGYDVKLNDLTAERIEGAIRTIRAGLSRQASRGFINPEEVEPALARIYPAEDLAEIGAADIAIEAATEDEELK